jgi:hypothetical protein
MHVLITIISNGMAREPKAHSGCRRKPGRGTDLTSDLERVGALTF